MFDFLLIGSNLKAFLFYGDAAVFQIGDQILKTFFFGGDLRPGGLNNVIGKSQLGRNGKSIALAGDANQKPVSGR